MKDFYLKKKEIFEILAKVYLIDEHPPFKGGPPFPPFHPPLKKGGPPFFKGGWTYEPSCPPFLRVV